jgi:tripartite-type tricarboxylate transporter receptor subunit TctC
MTTGGTPAPIIDRLDSEIAKALALPQVHNAFAKQGVDIFYLDSKQLGKFLHKEAARYSGLLAHSKVR